MKTYIWLGKLVIMTIISLFFSVFGIETLIGSFYLKNPFDFIMYFFSASLMILVSIVGIIFAVSRLYAFIREQKVQ